MNVDEFFQGQDEARQIFDAIARNMAKIGATTIRTSKSQVAFRRTKNVAIVWMPGKYLKNRPVAPLVLSVSLRQRDPSFRWKEITRIGSERFIHHLELFHATDVDNEVYQWLQKAWDQAA